LDLRERKEEEISGQCTLDTAWFVLLTKCLDGEIKEDEMGGACGTCGVEEERVHCCGGES
jgi:hypothetical protein